jgi:hypothetical protein
MVEQLSDIIDEFTNSFEECIKEMNNTELKTIKHNTIKDLLNINVKKCLALVKDCGKTAKTLRNTSPLQNYIKESFRSLDKSDKQNYDLEGLQGYRKFEKIIKFLYSTGKINFDTDIDINKISKVVVPETFKFNPNEIKTYNPNSDFDSDSNSENEQSYKSTNESDNEITNKQHYTSEDEYNNNNNDNDITSDSSEDEPTPTPPPTKTKKTKKKK